MGKRGHLVLSLLLGLLLGCAGRPPAYRTTAPVVELPPAEAAQAALAPVVPGPPIHADLELAFPEPDTIFSDEPEAYLAGRLDAPWGVPGRVDAVVVIDVSDSTSRNAGRYENRVRDRVRGLTRSEPDASILRYELASARLLLDDVDPRNIRLGIVSFAGAPDDTLPRMPSATTEVTLTRHLPALEAGLQRIARRGSWGRTDMAAGLDRAVDELIGRGRSRPDPGAAKVVVFFTDGTPTLPYPSQPAANELAVIRAAERAAAYGVRVFSFAVGPDALGRPVAAVEMARRTGGVFTPVKRPSDLSEAVKAVRLARVDELTIRNVTVGSGARKVHLGRDGTFDALVPLEPGKNRIFVRAVVGNITAEAERIVHYAPGSARPYVPPDLEQRRLALVQGGREVEVGIWQELDAQRREVELKAFEQLKELEIHVGDVAAPPPGP